MAKACSVSDHQPQDGGTQDKLETQTPLTITIPRGAPNSVVTPPKLIGT